MNTTNKAQAQFESGLNCAQSVISAFSEPLKFDEALALDITSGFGAGMGKLQNTCGAVTGAFMALSRYSSLQLKDRAEAKAKSNELIQKFEQRFKMLHGTTQCAEIIQVDLNTEKGQAAFKEYQMKENICMKCVKNATDIVNELIEE